MSLAAQSPHVKTARPRNPLQPVRVTASFVGGATRDDVIHGQAVLSIVSGDATDSDESAYWLKAVYDGERCVSFRLIKFGTGDQYDLPRDLSTCDCPDRVYRGERPGGCRHMVALQQALLTVTEAGPIRKPDRKAERFEATVPAVEAA
jgi:hypothetical protein